MASITIDRTDGLSSSIAFKAPVRGATTSNITLSGEQTIDGIAVVADDRVLVRAQTTGSENGIYVVDTGVWRRAKDFSSNRDVKRGTSVRVNEGSTYAMTTFAVSNASVTIGTTSLTFTSSQDEINSLLNARVFDTIAALRLFSSATIATEASVRGYYSATDGFGGTFYLDSTDTTTADDGGAVIVDAASRRWKRFFTAGVSLRSYGCKGDALGGTDGAITSGQTTFTSATANFTTSDVGKTISIRGAGALSGSNRLPLITTIVSRQAAGTVTVAAAASATVTGANYAYGTDDTTQVGRAITYAISQGTGVMERYGGSYFCDYVNLDPGLRYFIVEGAIRGWGRFSGGAHGGSQYGVVRLRGSNRFALSSDLSFCKVQCDVNMQLGDWCAIYLDNSDRCTVADCVISNLVDDANEDRYGILLYENVRGCTIKDNFIQGAVNPTQRHLLIDCLGEGSAFGGYFTDAEGDMTAATNPVTRNVITGNRLFYGSYAVNLQSCEDNIVSGNLCYGQNHRSIYLANACVRNTISHNLCLEFLSTGILLGYNCEENSIQGNFIYSTGTLFSGSTGEAGINLITGVKNNKVIGNYVDAHMRFGIYGAINCIGNHISGNTIKNFRNAGISIESQWQAAPSAWVTSTAYVVGNTVLVSSGAESRIWLCITNHTSGTFTTDVSSGYWVPLPMRPNYAAPTTVDPVNGGTSWARKDSFDNVIEGNVVLDAYIASVAVGIGLTQVGTTWDNYGQTLRDNEVRGTNLQRQFVVYEVNSGDLRDLVLLNNRFPSASSSAIYMSRKRSHCAESVGNTYIDDGSITVADGLTAIDVGYGTMFTLAAGTSDITDITGWFKVNQEITVRMISGRDLVYNSSKIRLLGATSAIGASADQLIRLINPNAVGTVIGYETWRNWDTARRGSATYDPANLVDGAGATTTVTVTGAALGDFAEASFSLDLQGITLTAWVSAADTVSVRFQNETGGAIDLASGTLRARVTKL